MTTAPTELPEPDRNAAQAAGELVADLRAIRRRTRRTRRGYRFPLLAFGILIAAATPLYIEHEPPPGPSTQGWNAPWAQAFGGSALEERAASPRELAVFWFVAIALGATAMVIWYRRRARRSGVRSRTAPSILTWAVISALLIGFPFVGRSAFGGSSAWFQGSTGRGTLALLVIGLGLCALAATERSPFLGVTALIYSATAVYSALGNPENTVYRILSWCGVPDSRMPFTLAPTATVLFPAAVLLLGAAVATAAEPAQARSAEPTPKPKPRPRLSPRKRRSR